MFPLILSDECNLITFLISLSETLKHCILLSALWSSAEARNKDRSSAESATVVGKYGFLLDKQLCMILPNERIEITACYIKHRKHCNLLSVLLSYT